MFIGTAKRIFLSFFLAFESIFIALPLFAQSGRNDVYIKYVHPRIYHFDLYDSEEKVYLNINNSSRNFEAHANFTKYVKKDMPKAGDKVIFHYSGYAKKKLSPLTATVWDKKKNIKLSDSDKVFVEDDIEAKVPFEGTISFILDRDSERSFYLKLSNTKHSITEKTDKCHLYFTRVAETTNTTNESKAEAKAKRKKIKIVETKSEIFPDEKEIIQDEQKSSDTLESPESPIDKTESGKEPEPEPEIDEKAIAQQEAEKLEQERLKKEMEFQKALENSAKASSSRYEKEYLQDYIVPDTPSLPTEAKYTDSLIKNPDATDFMGRTLLMKAAKLGNDWQIKQLLKSGAKVNIQDKDGWTALMYALRYQENMDCVQLLLNAGAKVKISNNYDTSPLLLAACYNNNPEILKKILDYYSISEKEVLRSLVMLLTEYHINEYLLAEKLAVYIERSIPLNNFYEGKTPLMYAALYGNSTNIIKMLLENNANAQLRSTEGKTAFDYAKLNNNLTRDKYFWELNRK